MKVADGKNSIIKVTSNIVILPLMAGPGMEKNINIVKKN